MQKILALSLITLVLDTGCSTIYGSKTVKNDALSGDEKSVAQADKKTGNEKVSEIQDPKMKAQTHFSLGQSYSLDNKTDQAIEEYKHAIIYDPHSAIIRKYLATEYLKKGIYSLALEEAKQVVILDSKIHLLFKHDL